MKFANIESFALNDLFKMIELFALLCHRDFKLKPLFFVMYSVFLVVSTNRKKKETKQVFFASLKEKYRHFDAFVQRCHYLSFEITVALLYKKKFLLPTLTL